MSAPAEHAPGVLRERDEDVELGARERDSTLSGSGAPRVRVDVDPQVADPHDATLPAAPVSPWSRPVAGGA